MHLPRPRWAVRSRTFTVGRGLCKAHSVFIANSIKAWSGHVSWTPGGPGAPAPVWETAERLQPSASAHAFLAFQAPGWTQPSPACLPLSSELQPILRPLPSLLHTGRDSSASGALTPAPRLHLPEPPGVSVDITSCRKPSLIPLCSQRGSTVSALCRLCILFRLLLQTSAELSNS